MQSSSHLQPSQASRSQAEIQAWLTARLATLLQMRPQQIQVSMPLDRCGIDSAIAAELVLDLEDWLGRELDPTLLLCGYPSIEVIAKHLGAAD